MSEEQEVSPGLLLQTEITDELRRAVSTGEAGPGGEILIDRLPLLLEAGELQLQPGLVVVPSHHIRSDQQETPAVGR